MIKKFNINKSVIILIMSQLFANNISFAQENFPDYIDSKNIYNKTNLTIPVFSLVTYNNVVMLESPSFLHAGKNTFIAQGYDGRMDKDYSLFRYSIRVGDSHNPAGQCQGINLFLHGLTLYDGNGSNGFHCHMISDGDQSEPIKSEITY